MKQSAHLAVRVPPSLVNHCAQEHWRLDQAEECTVLKSAARRITPRIGAVSC
jgi:hypothetical protein